MHAEKGISFRKNWRAHIYPEPSNVAWEGFNFACLEGHGDLVSRLIIRITGVIIWDIGIINP